MGRPKDLITSTSASLGRPAQRLDRRRIHPLEKSLDFGYDSQKMPARTTQSGFSQLMAQFRQSRRGLKLCKWLSSTRVRRFKSCRGRSTRSLLCSKKARYLLFGLLHGYMSIGMSRDLGRVNSSWATP